jgi:threonine/homoserine/homoserine lactone efflux protein
MMPMACGANFGARRTLPRMAGVAIGFPMMVVGVGLRGAGVVSRARWVSDVIRWAGAG